jgi:hypothetical protein
MASVKVPQVVEQSANMLGGVQVDTNVYVGTGLAGVPTLKVGYTPPTYVFEGTQTAVTLNIVFSTANAAPGDSFILRAGTGNPFGTSVISLVNASTGGTVFSTSSGKPLLKATFNGAQWK